MEHQQLLPGWPRAFRYAMTRLQFPPHALTQPTRATPQAVSGPGRKGKSKDALINADKHEQGFQNGISQ